MKEDGECLCQAVGHKRFINYFHSQLLLLANVRREIELNVKGNVIKYHGDIIKISRSNIPRTNGRASVMQRMGKE